LHNLDESGSPFSSYNGGLASVDWSRFSLPTGMSWLATVRATNASAEAATVLSVYASDGVTLLKRVQGSLKNGTTLEFVPPANVGGVYWLSVAALGQAVSVSYQLVFQQELLTYEVSMEQAEIPVSRGANTVVIPMTLGVLQGNADLVSLQYRVIPVTAPAEYFEVKNDWTNLEWTSAEKTLKQKELRIPITVPGTTGSWAGSLDFRVEIQTLAGGNCRIVSGSESTLVKLYSQAVFAPRPSTTALQLFEEIPVNLVFPICPGSVYTFSNEGILPAGLNVVHDPTNHLVRISGTPTSASESTVTLILKNGAQETDRLELAMSVLEMNNEGGNATAFSGYLLAASRNGSPLGSLIITREAGKFIAKVHCQDSLQPLDFESAGWSGYNPETGDLLLEFAEVSGNILSLRLSLQGQGTGTFRSAIGVEYSVSFYPLTSVPEEYLGSYSVALRLSFEEENFALGWLLLNIEENGRVTYSGELIDGSKFDHGETWLFNLQAGEGTVVFFVPLNWNADTGRYAGRLAGLLSLLPISERNGNDACVSDCGGMSIWERAVDDFDVLAPCGTIYNAEKTLAEQIGLANGLFYLETQKTEENGFIVSNRIAFQESADVAGLIMQNVGTGLLAGELSSLQLNRSRGTFTGTIQVLTQSEGSKELTRNPVLLFGVFTPVTSDCCSIGSDLYAGYGYYHWNGKPYCFRLSPVEKPKASAPDLLELAGQTQDFNYVFAADAVQAVISNPSGRLLYQRNDNQRLFYASQEGHLTEQLATESGWKLVALDETMVESEILEIPLLKAQNLQTFNLDGGEGVVELHSGWNLIAVPWNVFPAQDTILPEGLFAYDPTSKAFVQAVK
ncbi:MAG: hypothetical protein WCT05_16720, partial [Lentisphaeria bacterium]